MDGEAHTVIAGMRAQQEDGEDAMGGGSYNGGGQDPMIPDIIRCTFRLNHPRHCQPMQSLGG